MLLTEGKSQFHAWCVHSHACMHMCRGRGGNVISHLQQHTWCYFSGYGAVEYAASCFCNQYVKQWLGYLNAVGFVSILMWAITGKVSSWNTTFLWVDNFRLTSSELKKKLPGGVQAVLTPDNTKDILAVVKSVLLHTKAWCCTTHQIIICEGCCTWIKLNRYFCVYKQRTLLLKLIQ